MMYGLIVLGGALAIALRRARRLDHDPPMRALLSLQYELFGLASANGRSALEEHARDWRTSKIFSRYPSIASDDIIRTFLIDAMRLLVDDANSKDLDHLLSASLRIARRRGASWRQLRSLECIRRGTLATSRGATPVTAVRSGRAALGAGERPSTMAITPVIRLTDLIPRRELPAAVDHG